MKYELDTQQITELKETIRSSVYQFIDETMDKTIQTFLEEKKKEIVETDKLKKVLVLIGRYEILTFSDVQRSINLPEHELKKIISVLEKDELITVKEAVGNTYLSRNKNVKMSKVYKSKKGKKTENYDKVENAVSKVVDMIYNSTKEWSISELVIEGIGIRKQPQYTNLLHKRLLPYIEKGEKVKLRRTPSGHARYSSIKQTTN